MKEGRGGGRGENDGEGEGQRKGGGREENCKQYNLVITTVYVDLCSEMLKHMLKSNYSFHKVSELQKAEKGGYFSSLNM